MQGRVHWQRSCPSGQTHVTKSEHKQWRHFQAHVFSWPSCTTPDNETEATSLLAAAHAVRLSSAAARGAGREFGWPHGMSPKPRPRLHHAAPAPAPPAACCAAVVARQTGLCSVQCSAPCSSKQYHTEGCPH